MLSPSSDAFGGVRFPQALPPERIQPYKISTYARSAGSPCSGKSTVVLQPIMEQTEDPGAPGEVAQRLKGVRSRSALQTTVYRLWTPQGCPTSESGEMPNDQAPMTRENDEH